MGADRSRRCLDALGGVLGGVIGTRFIEWMSGNWHEIHRYYSQIRLRLNAQSAVSGVSPTVPRFSNAEGARYTLRRLLLANHQSRRHRSETG